MCNSHNCFGYTRSTSRKNIFELLLVHSFKSGYLGSIHLKFPVGKNLDVA